MSACTALAVVLAVAWPGRVPFVVQAAGLAAAVALFGVPHGALDTWVGRAALEPRLGRRWRLWFGLGYVGSAGLVVALWLVAPVFALAGFLTLSAFHFGAGDTHPAAARGLRWVEAFARGAIPVVVPAVAFSEEVGRLFAWVMPGGTANDGARVAGALAWTGPRLLGPALALVVVGHAARARWARAPRRRAVHAMAAAEIVALAGLFAAVAPLPAFVVYFCGWHSVRHTLELAARLDPCSARRGLARFARLAAPATAAAVAAGLIAWLALRPEQGGAPAAVQTVFVLLSALTVPHMAVNALASGEGEPGRG